MLFFKAKYVKMLFLAKYLKKYVKCESHLFPNSNYNVPNQRASAPFWNSFADLALEVCCYFPALEQLIIQCNNGLGDPLRCQSCSGGVEVDLVEGA